MKVRLCIPCSLLVIQDWSIWSTLFIFKLDLFVQTLSLIRYFWFVILPFPFFSLPDLIISGGSLPLFEILPTFIFRLSIPMMYSRLLFFLSQVVSPNGSALCSWPEFCSSLPDKWGTHRFSPLWYTALVRLVTLFLDPFSLFSLYMEYVTSPSPLPVVFKKAHMKIFLWLRLCNLTNMQSKDWIVLMLKSSSQVVFGWQICSQLMNSISIIIHWIFVDSSFLDCSSSSSSLLFQLVRYLGCDLNTPKQYPISALKPNLCTIKVYLSHIILLLLVQKHLLISTFKVDVLVSFSFIFL